MPFDTLGSDVFRVRRQRSVLMTFATVLVLNVCSVVLGQKEVPLPDLSAATQKALETLDSPVDLEVNGPEIEAALRQVAREMKVSIRIDLPTLMGRKVILADPAPTRLKGDSLRSALQQLLAPPTAVMNAPVPISAEEGAIQIDSFRRAPTPREGSFEQGRWVVNGRVVDETGNAAPHASIRLYCWAWVMLTTADENGRFFATVPTNGKLEIEAWDSKGERQGWMHVGHEGGQGGRGYSPKVTLKPPKTASVLVTKKGMPIEGARVVLIGGGYPYDGFNTFPTGESTVQIPADLAVEAVIAWKHGAGVDYVASREFGTTRGSSQPLLSTDQPINLQLSQGPAIRFRILDQFDRPVARTPFDPWVLNKPGSGASFNLTHLHCRETQFTDAEGFVTFDWLPEWQKDRVNFSGWGASHSRADIDLTLKDAASQLQTIRVERMATVRGRVIGMDGKPVRDAYVVARGGGFPMKKFSANGIADDDGGFKFAVAAQQAYLFVAMSRDKKQISAVEERVVEDVANEVNDIDLYLRPGIRVFGQLEARPVWTDETRPVLRLVGDDLNTRQDVNLPSNDSLTPVRAVDEIRIEPDPRGKFSVLVGPGRYEFAPTKDAPGFPFELTEQAEYEVVLPPL